MISVLAWDPSSTCTGWAVLTCTEQWRKPCVDNYGVIRRKGGALWMPALAENVTKVARLHTTNYTVFEKAARPYGFKMSYKAFNTYAAAVTVVQNSLNVVFGCDNVFAVYPQTWKATQKKERTIARANMLYELELGRKQHDIADAIMLGTWFIERMRVHPIPPAHSCTL